MTRCAVVGVGALGTSLCRQILQEWDNATVVGITKTVSNHDEIRNRVGSGGDRFQLLTAGDAAVRTEKFQNVVFCAPPSGFADYPAAVKEAAELYWAGPDAGGLYVFTSSGAVYVFALN
jgi:hypothetical protein